MSNLQTVLVAPAKVVFAQVAQFVVNILLVSVILIIGWLISEIIKGAVTKILKAVKIDNLSKNIGLDAILAKGDSHVSLSDLIGGICYWLSLLITFVVALNAVGLSVAADLLQKVVLFVPNIVSAIFILVVGMFASAIVKRLVKTAANNAGISKSALFGNIAEVVIIIFAAAIALEQLQIGARIVELTITIILGSLGLGYAIAFGLGCKDLVGRSVSSFVDKLKK